MSGQGDKDLLKRLRQERQAAIARAKERIKTQGADMKRIRERLAQGPATVPEIAEATGLPPAQTLWSLTALRKYGLAVEGDKRGAYFQYALAGQDPAGGQDAA